MMSSTQTIQSIYTDGACSGNPGRGGWGTVIYFSNGSVHEIGDACSQTTNNRMEMQAAIAGLKYLQSSAQNEPVTLYTDSEYLINCVTKWVKSWKRKGWKKSDGQPVLNQDLLEILDELNNNAKIKWQHVRGHAGNIGNERCDAIARAFASGKPPSLQQLSPNHRESSIPNIDEANVAKVSDNSKNSTIINKDNQYPGNSDPDIKNITTMEPFPATVTTSVEEIPHEARVGQLRNLIETLRIADEIASSGYLITSSELADLMDVHASAVTSRGDQWRWRNWIVSRVRREGNQILWELERGDGLPTGKNGEEGE
jgi:ribonuclease HI